MRALRENWAFILVLLIALSLIFLLIALQGAILSSQQDPENTQNNGFLYTLRQQLALMIAPAADTPTAVPPTATAVPPTPTPLPPPPTATALPPPPTLTPLPPATVIAVATPIILPTATLVVLPTNTVAALPTATSAPPTPTTPPVAAVGDSNTSTSPQVTGQRADFRLGYVDRQDGCPFATEVVGLVLQQNLNFSIELVPYATLDQLYLALASTDETQRVDMTVCYTDPNDRSYLEKHFGFVILVGSAYRQFEDKSFLVLSNAAAKKVIQRELPCMYNFLTKLRINNEDFQNPTAQTWYETHTELIQSWTNCQ